jgi:succinate dehydrogenase/fumarate reductase flavoprotein subunit
MVMRASLQRQETRRSPYGFVRAEYPERDDEHFLCFLSQQLVDGQVTFTKVAPR